MEWIKIEILKSQFPKRISNQEIKTTITKLEMATEEEDTRITTMIEGKMAGEDNEEIEVIDREVIEEGEEVEEEEEEDRVNRMGIS